MHCIRKAINLEPSQYATLADFCRIFEENMDRFYMLSFLLTADHSLAEKCFVGGLAGSTRGRPAFVEWAESWALRKIVQNAIELVHPRLTGDRTSSALAERNTEHAATEPEEAARILALPAFDRFAFVLSVLERYSDQECAVLLDCTPSQFVTARIRAMPALSQERNAACNLILDEDTRGAKHSG